MFPYFKRYIMRLDLTLPSAEPELPHGLTWHAWDESLVDTHASVKFLAFQHSADTQIFPNLGSLTGCRLLMRAIRESHEFCAAGTWLINTREGAVGTIQTLLADRMAMIQNVGVIPAYRNRGLASALVLQLIAHVRTLDARRVQLEVSANNVAALKVYRRIGFRLYNTLYRSVDRSVDRSVVDSSIDALGAGI
jgi:ribosomal protein S18 acetylase RimI-like enzyme